MNLCLKIEEKKKVGKTINHVNLSYVNRVTKVKL